MILIASVLVVLLAQQGIDWKKDYASTLAAARQKERLIVVHFWLKGRPLCTAMLEETFSNAEVIRISNEKFVNVRVEIDSRPDLFRNTVGGRGGLATCILDITGDVVSVLPGFASAEDYHRFLERSLKGYPELRAARDAASSDDPQALVALAEAYLALESRRRAEECFERVIASAKASEPARVRAYEHLARMSVLRGRNLEARAYLAEVRKLDPENRIARADGVLLTEALALAIERKHAESARRLDEALAKYPKSREADFMKFTLGFVLHQVPENTRALEVLEALVRDYPASAWAKSAKEQIDHIKNPQPDHTH